jgi:GT2 family glycosyltransferase
MRKNYIVYALIVTYNRLNFLKKCLKSLLNQTYPIYKIIVVDNKSSDGTIDYLKLLSKKNKKVETLFNKNNLGMANALNKALKKIWNKKWDYVWISDDDNIADKNALLNLIQKADNTTILNSLLIDYKNKKNLTFERIDLKNGKIYKNIDNFKLNEEIFDSIPLNFTLIPKTAFKKNGFFSEDYFIRGEEIDFILKSLLNGLNLKVLSKSKAYCLNQRNIKTFKLFGIKINRELVESWKLYYVIRNNLFIVNKYQKLIPEKNKEIFFRFFPYLRYNFIYFFLFYFFYNLFLLIFIQRSNLKINLKYLMLAYYHFFILKKGKI